MPAITSHRSQGIDALRAVAALAIVFHHSHVPSIGVPVYDAWLSFFRDHGRLGVDLFFVLSGFCIHWGYSRPGERFDAKKYALRRWWRIYPPYFFALGLAVLLNLGTNFWKFRVGGEVTWENFGAMSVLTHVFLVHNLFASTIATISGPFWTIAMEMQLYLLYLAARPLFFSKKGWVAVSVAAFLLHLVAARMHRLGYEFEPLSVFRFWPEWLAGAFVSHLLRKRPELPERWGLHLAAFATLVGAGAWFHAHPVSGTASVSQHLFVISFAFLLLLAVRWKDAFERPALAWLPAIGLFSYSLYLVHFLFIDRWRVFVLPYFSEGWPRFAGSLGSILAVLGICYAFFAFFERPFLRKSASMLR